MTEKRENGYSAQGILIGLAGFRCSRCQEPLGGDLFCEECRIGHCPFCGDSAVLLPRRLDSYMNGACVSHSLALDVSQWVKRRGRTRNGGKKRSTVAAEQMVCLADIPQPSILMDSEPLRSMGERGELREFFGDLAPILDALNPSGWADRAVFTDRLLGSSAKKIIKLRFPPREGTPSIRCYFTRDKAELVGAIEATAFRFEQEIERWYSTRPPFCEAPG